MTEAATRSEAVLVFDLGGVLVETRTVQALARWLPALGADEIARRWQRSRALAEFESGRLAAEAFAREFVREWGLELSPHEFLASFAEWVTGFYRGAPELLRALRLRYRLACLSNTNPVHWARLREAQTLFDVCFASFRTGLMKPDARAFRHALEALGAEPARVWFFDDLAENVA
ncbi:MAG: HAD-IA family hydrolase, partial [Burkholderiales bacterium]|nr:HAD-IA family hydrolase [Burkholderiales bacterium]